MSRSAFAARFSELVGETPMQYVARWRMNSALSWLKENDTPLGELANQLGYQSEAAFSRAFKRFMGMTPGAAREQTKRKASAPVVIPLGRWLGQVWWRWGENSPRSSPRLLRS